MATATVTTEWKPYEQHKGFFRLSEGVLQFAPMRGDGTMRIEDVSEVDFGELNARAAADCRAISQVLALKRGSRC